MFQQILYNSLKQNNLLLTFNTITDFGDVIKGTNLSNMIRLHFKIPYSAHTYSIGRRYMKNYINYQ